MFCKVVCALFLVGLSTPSSLGLGTPSIELLATLQSTHYVYVKAALDETDVLTSLIYYVDDDLKVNAEHYFLDLAAEELEQLAPLKEGCDESDSCLACFDSEGKLSEIASNITTNLVAYLVKQKSDFNVTIADIKSNLEESALLSTVVYQQFKDSSDFQNDATNYYNRIRVAIAYESQLFEKTVNSTINKLVTYSVDATVDATTQMQTIFNQIVECAEQ